MAYSDKPMKKDTSGVPYPQYFDTNINDWVVLQGVGATPIRLSDGTNEITLNADGSINVGGSLPSGTNVIGKVELSNGTTAVVVDSHGSLQFYPVDTSGAALFTSANPGEVQLSGSNTADVTFQNAVAASGNGTAVSVKGYKTLVIEVYGATSPAGTVNFEAAGTSGVFAAITGTNLNGLSQSTSTSSIGTTPVQWQFDVEALDQFQCPVTWTAGTITVKGRLQA